MQDPRLYSREAVECRLDALASQHWSVIGTKPRAYLAGPMRGLPEFNFHAFERCTTLLRDAGWEVISPAEEDLNRVANRIWPGATWEGLDEPSRLRVWETATDTESVFLTFREVIAHDLHIIAGWADAVFVMPGYEESSGADIEIKTARAVGIPVYSLLSGREISEREDLLFLREEVGPAPEVERDTIPSDSAARKGLPVATGVIDYFPAALAAVAAVSKYGNDKHNPGEELHWARGKSMDHADALARHLIDRGSIDQDTGQRHSAELAWRALALLQQELEDAGEAPLPRGAR